MEREAVESLDKETLIRVVLSQAETIAALTRQVEMLTARVAELEARLGLPPKTPGNSSTPAWISGFTFMVGGFWRCPAVSGGRRADRLGWGSTS